jgi:hypothetical protein
MRRESVGSKPPRFGSSTGKTSKPPSPKTIVQLPPAPPTSKEFISLFPGQNVNVHHDAHLLNLFFVCCIASISHGYLLYYEVSTSSFMYVVDIY